MQRSEAELQALLEGLRSRGEIKRLGAQADEDPQLRAELEALAGKRGLLVEAGEPGKRLVRALLQREDAAQVRKNPIRVDEPFHCACCGLDVLAGGARVRDHCPRCLRSLHLDRVPGDRAADCGGILDPVRFELAAGEVHIHYRCRRCQYPWRGRAHPEDAVPPSLDPADLPACQA